MLCLVHLPWRCQDYNTPPVNTLNVEIKIRNVPFVLSHFHKPEYEWVIFMLNGFY
jgi:hypothetical protein